MRTTTRFILYLISLLSIGLSLIALKSIVDLMNPAACNNIWNTHVCPTLVVIPPSHYYLPFVFFFSLIIVSFVSYKLARHLKK